MLNNAGLELLENDTIWAEAQSSLVQI